MSYPALVPNRRSVSMGDFPVKAYESMSGAETRIRYGDQRRQATLELTYDRLTPTEADQIAAHYDSVEGTTYTFSVGTPLTEGWISGTRVQGNGQWRYADPPSFNQLGGECEQLSATVRLVTVVG